MEIEIEEATRSMDLKLAGLPQICLLMKCRKIGQFTERSVSDRTETGSCPGKIGALDEKIYIDEWTKFELSITELCERRAFKSQ